MKTLTFRVLLGAVAGGGLAAKKGKRGTLLIMKSVIQIGKDDVSFNVYCLRI